MKDLVRNLQKISIPTVNNAIQNIEVPSTSMAQILEKQRSVLDTFA